MRPRQALRVLFSARSWSHLLVLGAIWWAFLSEVDKIYTNDFWLRFEGFCVVSAGAEAEQTAQDEAAREQGTVPETLNPKP